MRLRFFGLLLWAGLLAACSGPSGVAPYARPFEPIESAAHTKSAVYWTLFASCSYPQIQYAGLPLKMKSKAKNYDCTAKNGLSYTSGLSVDSSGRLWVLSFSKSGGNPSEVAVFKLPLKSTSVQQYTFVLGGTNGADALAFDPSGNLWVSSPGSASVLEYTGPFDKNGTLYPAITLSVPSGYNMYSVAFDKSGNLYASNVDSTGTDSIGVVAPPYNVQPYWLNGITAPGAIAFDKSGNLYASTNGSTPAIARYDSNDLKNGDKPSIIDSTGLPASSYEAAFAFTKAGDLYAANCGNGSNAGIDVWPLSRQKFSSKLKPSVLYTNADLAKVGCAWGIAIK